MTLSQAIKQLTDAGVPTPAGDARILLSEICKIPRSRVLIMADEEINEPAFDDAIKRRAAREPLQYILGKWWFCGLCFKVSPDCLIPRPETEVLVEAAYEDIPSGGHILDLCTGSGCIALSLLHMRGDVTADLVDISPAALGIAKENAEALGLFDRCRFITHDVTKGTALEMHEKYDLITANPPYIRESEMASLEAELAFEPRIALTDGGNGMSIVYAILDTYPSLLSENGVLLIEIGSDEGAEALSYANARGLGAQILPDLSGRDRVLICRKL